MPPKKIVKEEKLILGRPGNNLKMGIVGLPNVGKSTLFNTLTRTDLGKAGNFPYATIDPEEARVPLPDERFNWLCDFYKPASKVPAWLTVIDIAGLTKGASTGVGLGNAFLSHIRAVDGIFQLVRAFDDDEIVHVEGDVNPVRDLEIIHDELRIKDIEFIEKHMEGLKKLTARAGQTGEKAKKEELNVVEKIHKWLTVDNNDVRKGEWNNKEVEIINTLQLLTAKPVIYLVNISETDFIRKKNSWLKKISAWVQENNPGDLIIPLSVGFEENLSLIGNLEEEKKKCESLEVQSSLPKIIISGYKALHLINYFTCGPDEVRAWTIRKGIKAPQAAGVIHTDFEKKFIVGEIFKYQDLKENGSEPAVKSAGKYMTKGKDYVVEDGDICLWKHGQ